MEFIVLKSYRQIRKFFPFLMMEEEKMVTYATRLCLALGKGSGSEGVSGKVGL